VKEGRLQRITNAGELIRLPVTKKQALNPRRSREVIDEIVRLVFE